MRLEELSNALRGTSDAKMRLAGLDEEYARSQALRDKPMFTKPNEYGYISPLGVLGDMIAHSRGRAMARDLKPQREAARLQIAEGENAPALYQAKVAADKVKQDQANWENEMFQNAALQQEQQAHQVMLQQAKDAEARKAAKLMADAKKSAGENSRVMVLPDGSDPVNVYESDEGSKRMEMVNGVPTLVPFDDTGRIDEKTMLENRLKQQKLDGDGPTIEEQVDEALDNLDYLHTTVIDQSLKPGTGHEIWDLRRKVSEWTPFDPDAQVSTHRMKNIELLSIMPILQSKVFGKLSDSDFKAIRETAPGADKEPLVTLRWMNDKLKPELRRLAKKANLTEAQSARISAKIDSIIKDGYKAQYPERYIEIYGKEGLTGDDGPKPLPPGIDESERAEYEAYVASLPKDK